MKKYLIAFILYIALLFSFHPLCAQITSDSVSIKGKINNYNINDDTLHIVELWVQDPVKDGIQTFYGVVNPDGSFLINAPLHYLQDVDLKLNQSFLKLLVKNGDTIHVSFNSSDILKTATFRGANSTINKEFATYQMAWRNYIDKKYHNQAQRMVELKKMQKGTPDKFKAYILERFKNDTSFCNTILKNNNIGDTLKLWAITQLKYECAGDLLYYTSSANIGASNGHPPKSYYDFFQTFPINNNSASISSAYVDYLSSYGEYLIAKTNIEVPVVLIGRYILQASKTLSPKQTTRLTKIANKALIDNLSIFDILFVQKVMNENDGERADLITDSLTNYCTDAIISLYIKETSGYARDALLSAWIYKIVTEAKDVEFIKTRIVIYNNEIENKYMQKEIATALKIETDKLKDYSLSANSNIDFVPVTEVDSVFNAITQKYRGKTIYVDFWGTWCVPCLEEMPFSKNLYNYFKGKDIVFLYLCVESKENIWKAVVADKQIPGENYLLTGSQYRALVKKFNINGLPHYAIIDKRGYIKEQDALRPGDTALKKLLALMIK